MVVESPARALTLQRLLPRELVVRATRGHVARLEPGAGGVPRITPLRGQGRVLQELRRLSRGLPLLLATDPDREGEAIAWAVAVALGREREACRVEIDALVPGAVAPVTNRITTLSRFPVPMVNSGLLNVAEMLFQVVLVAVACDRSVPVQVPQTATLPVVGLYSIRSAS